MNFMSYFSTNENEMSNRDDLSVTQRPRWMMHDFSFADQSWYFVFQPHRVFFFLISWIMCEDPNLSLLFLSPVPLLGGAAHC